MDDSDVEILAYIQHLVNVVLSPVPCPINDDDDSDFDEDIVRQVFQVDEAMRLRGPREAMLRNQGFIELVMSPNYDPKQFKSHFRMPWETFMHLENRIGGLISRQGETGRPTIPVRKQILSTLWLLGTPDSYRSVGEHFDMGKATLHDCVDRVVRALGSIAREVIQWPTGDALRATKRKFARRRRGLLGTIGAIDGTYIPIPAPEIEPIAYRTRKKNFAVVAQGVSNAEMHFTDFYVGYPGAVPDIRNFENSDLCRDVVQNIARFFPNGEFISHHDCNERLSSNREVIERAWCLLKGRFRRLKYLDMSRVDKIPATVLACAVLHNLCLRGFDPGFENVADIEQYICQGQEQNDGQDDAAAEGNDAAAEGNDEGNKGENALANVMVRWTEEGRAKRENLRLILTGAEQ